MLQNTMQASSQIEDKLCIWAQSKSAVPRQWTKLKELFRHSSKTFVSYSLNSHPKADFRTENPDTEPNEFAHA